MIGVQEIIQFLLKSCTIRCILNELDQMSTLGALALYIIMGSYGLVLRTPLVTSLNSDSTDTELRRIWALGRRVVWRVLKIVILMTDYMKTTDQIEKLNGSLSLYSITLLIFCKYHESVKWLAMSFKELRIK